MKNKILYAISAILCLLVFTNPSVVYSQTKKSKEYSKYLKSYELVKMAYQKLADLEYKDGIDLCTQAISIDPTNYDAYYMRGQCERFYNINTRDSALADFNCCIKINPKYARAYASKGELEINTPADAINDLTNSIYYCEKSDKIHLAEYYTSRADMRTMVLDWIGAIEDSNKAIFYNNSNMTAYVVRAQAKIERGDYYNAIQDCDRAISITPGFDSNSYYYRGVAELKIGNKDKACDDFYQAKKISGSYSYYKLNEAIRENCQ